MQFNNCHTNKIPILIYKLFEYQTIFVLIFYDILGFRRRDRCHSNFEENEITEITLYSISKKKRQNEIVNELDLYLT